MPRIQLKPNSPEYLDKKKHVSGRSCEFPSCPMSGTHKAPKHRGLNEYHHFCLDHVKEYNNSWNFFNGMSDREIEEHMLRGIYGDRPTWRPDKGAGPEDFIHRKAQQTYRGTDKEPDGKKRASGVAAYHHDSLEYKAMALFGLEPPLDMKVIKDRYKTLAKKNHPDHNPGKEDAEELLKEINLAYTVLKDAFEKFEKMKER